MTAEPFKVWITRAEPGATATAERVRALGHVPLVAPLLVVEPEGPVAIDLSGVAAFAFTSANGVRAFTARSPERALPVYAVGSATAEAARAVGFTSVTHFDGDVGDLADGLVAHAAQIHGVVLHPGAAEPAGDLAGAAAKHGVTVRRLALYRTVAPALGADHLAALAEADVALVHSPRGGAVLAGALRSHPRVDLKVLAISEAALTPLDDLPLAARTAAVRPRESDLLALLASG
jgi:uroporphyrinogen-III synthase